MQRQLEAAAAAAGVDLPPPPPKASDALRAALGVGADEAAAMEREVRAAQRRLREEEREQLEQHQEGGGRFAWGSSTSGSGGGGGRGAAPVVVDVEAEEVAATAPPPPTTTRPQQQPPAAAAAATSSSSSSGDSGSSSGTGGKRPWGAWGRNERIARSGGSLLSQARGSAGSGSGPQPPSAATDMSAPSTSSPSSTTTTSSTTATSATNAPQPTGDGATIVSKRAGSSRPRRAPSDPKARQDRVRDALRAAAEEWQAPVSDAAANDSGDDPDAIPANLIGGSGSGGGKGGGAQPWWRARFEALYLPTLDYGDGAVGFVQADVSLRPGARDVRVLAFEDRADALACLAVMRSWPEAAGAALAVGAMRTETLEADLRSAWLEQRAAAEAARWAAPSSGGGGGAAAAAGPAPAPPSPPAGVAVFRRGKLPLRPGMGRDDFMQAVVYHAAAQGALGRVGYDFGD